MAPSKCALDAHEQPSTEMRAEWKRISRLTPAEITDGMIDDPRAPLEHSGFVETRPISKEQIGAAFGALDPGLKELAEDEGRVLYHPLIPDLLIAPRLIPQTVQLELLQRLLHRDLSNPDHDTNMHLHYTLPYPDGEDKSFFSIPPDEPDVWTPKETGPHKPLTTRRVLQKRLHWVTLGGQYDWTNRVYPGTEPPPFPEDIGNFLEALFPETRAQAAICNLYSPGDTMMMHRDVSEETDRGLISVSIGCDGLFMIAPDGVDFEADNKGKRYLLVKLRSGDVIYMTRKSRYAWHGVPKILPDTCPAALEAWPAASGHYAEWRNWMANKRVNLNVRQMRE